jgi:hypothetical protein
MYSEYGGIKFINDYVYSRRNYLKANKPQNVNWGGYESTSNTVRNILIELWNNISKGNYSDENMDKVNSYTKSFEVRKRIYSDYDIHMRPVNNEEFEDYESYLIFADIMEKTYDYTKCLKYFSCLLKVDDSLLSVEALLDAGLKGHLAAIISHELDFFYELAIVHNLEVER